MSESCPPPRTLASPASLTMLAILLVLLTVTAYWQTVDFDFINLDDPQYLYMNERLMDGLSFGDIVWAFTTVHLANWTPVTWLSYILDYALFEFDPTGYHVTNVLLHCLATVILFAFLLHATRRTWPSFAVALLFALHPLHVESVAWIAERKDVLSALFGFAALLAYSGYVRAPSAARLTATFLLFALGLAAKSMVVTVPVLLLLLDYWPFRRVRFDDRRTLWNGLRPLLVEKAPFFVAGGAVGILTIYAQRAGGGLRTLDDLTLPARLANAATAYVLYLRDAFWPTGLAAYYPYPDRNQLLGLGLVAAGFLVIVTGIALRWYRRAPYFVVGWFWYLVTLLPVIGIVHVGGQARADRYTYIPLVGIFIVAAWAVDSIRVTWLRTVWWPATAVLIVFMLPLTWVQVGYWRNSETLFRHTVNVTGDNTMAHAQLGQALLTKGDYVGAQDHLEQAVAVAPKNSFAWRALGHVHYERGAPAEAIACYQRSLAALREKQRVPRAKSYAGLGVARLALDDLDGAMESLSEALRLEPKLSDALSNMGALYLMRGEPQLALPYLERALEQSPNDPVVLTNMAYARSLTGDMDDARRLVERALRQDPGYEKAVSLWDYLDTQTPAPPQDE